jgi:hypothetical protein
MDGLAGGSWLPDLARAVEGPPGLILDPTRVLQPFLDPSLQGAHLAGSLLPVRGLRGQARGGDDAMVPELRTGLGLARQLRNHAPTTSRYTAMTVEWDMLVGLDRWLERLGNRPGPLRAALAELRRHEAAAPGDITDSARADYVIAEHILRGLRPEQLFDLRASPGFRPLAGAVVAAWQVPWERRRQERVLLWLAGVEDPQADGRFPAPWLAFTVNASAARWTRLREDELAASTERRVAVLVLALRLYQAEKGHPPQTLDALVPEYLSALPADPYDPAGKPLRYRVSRGETIELPRALVVRWAMPEARHLPAGQMIVWSVGPDGRDDGGARHARVHYDARDTGPADLLFAVPPPKP